MKFGSLLPQLWEDREGGDPFRNLHRQIDRVFEDFGRGMRLPALSTRDEFFAPRIDVTESDEAIQLTAELPGVEEKDVQVNLTGNLLTLKGEKKLDHEEEKKDYRLVERAYGSFERRLTIPFDIDPDKVSATFEKGVLTVTVPKPPEAAEKSTRISISSK